MADDHTPNSELESREPTVEDLRDLCRELNDTGLNNAASCHRSSESVF
jgi:hypothetical protein